MYTRNESIIKELDKKKVLVAAHRGTCGGNVIQNTCLAYQNALLHGADMIEVDVSMTIDGVFFAFHNGEEKVELGVQRDIRDMTAREVESMKTLNKKACAIMNKYNVKCATDITGFGLMGHAYKMALASNVTIELQSSALPMFNKTYEVLDMGCIPGAAFTNMRYVGSNILIDDDVDYNLKMLSFDPQTAGGLFICVNKDNAENILADLWREGIDCATIIGRVSKKEKEFIHLVK